MTYRLSVEKEADRFLLKLKDKHLVAAIKKKIDQILENPYHFKPLRKDLRNKWRVHVLKSFVLIYEIDEKEQTVKVIKIKHHDDAYR